MKKIVTCKQMKELDGNTINNHGIPSLVLMERASLAVVEQLEKRRETLPKVLAVCGMGNNGGDGIAIARILKGRGYDARVHLVGNPEKMTAETRQQYAIAQSYHVPFVNNPKWEEYTTIVDAVFGVGLMRNIEGVFAETLAAMNVCPARKMAVDIPSGIDGDTGQVLGTAFRADETVTFAFGKPGLYLYPGADYAGKVTVSDIGIYAEKPLRPDMAILEEKEIPLWMPKRKPGGNKGTFGKVLVVASAKNMAGAGLLCARGCFAAGAGMVRIHTVEENRVICQTVLPEAMVTVQEEGKAELALLEKDLQWCDVVAAGPGLGLGKTSEILMEYLLANCHKPMVLDADGLNLLSRHPRWKSYLGKHCIVTPHLGEMSRLNGVSIEEIKKNPVKYAEEFQRETGAVCVLKDARSVIATEDKVYLNTSGNDGMATAGSGDVLGGILAGLLAQGLSVPEAAPLGAYLHGIGGDEAKLLKGRRGMLSGDIIQGLLEFWKRNEE